MKTKIIVENVGVDAGLIMVADKDYYKKYKDVFDQKFSHQFDIDKGEYKVNWRIKKSWNGSIQGTGEVNITSGVLYVSDPCYIAEDWGKWLKDTNVGDIEPNGTLLIDKMGGDGVYKVELTFEKIKNGDKKSEKVNWNKEFPLTSICRHDLRDINLTTQEIESLDNEDMKRIASKLADAYLENGFWDDLKIIVEDILKDKDKEKNG